MAGSQKEGRGSSDTEAHCIERCCNRAGSGVEHVQLYTDVVVVIPGATKDLAWRGQYPSTGQTGEGEGGKPLLEVSVEHSRVNCLEYGERVLSIEVKDHSEERLTSVWAGEG